MNSSHRILCLLLFSLLPGCGQGAAVREYDVEREQDKVLTSDLLRDQFEAIPFRWKVPSDWKVADNDQFSVFAWKVGEGEDAARITISDLPASAGLEPQFLRWRGQLKLPEADPAEVLKTVETLQMKELSGKYIEIPGETESILGMIVPYRDKLWIFKYRSTSAAAEKNGKAFRGFCESLSAG